MNIFGIVDDMSEKAMEKMFLQLIDGLNREDLDMAVKENLSLLDQTALCNPRALSMAERLAKRFSGQEHLLTTENVLKWIKEKRYELYFGIISNPKARKWFESQIREFREFLF